MELPEVPREEAEVGVREQPDDQRRPELYPEPDLEKEHMREFKPRFYTKIRRRRWRRKLC